MATRSAPLLRRYARMAKTYDRRYETYSRRTHRAVLQAMDRLSPEARSLLDVACGTGAFLERATRVLPHLRYAGVDLSPNMLQQARLRLAMRSDIELREAEAEALPFEDQAFDIVTCSNAFHLIVDQPKALREFRRVLGPDGTLIVIDWDRRHASMAMMSAYYALFGRHPRHILTGAELCDTVSRSGFHVAESRPIGTSWFWKLRLVAALPNERSSNQRPSRAASPRMASMHS